MALRFEAIAPPKLFRAVLGAEVVAIEFGSTPVDLETLGLQDAQRVARVLRRSPDLFREVP